MGTRFSLGFDGGGTKTSGALSDSAGTVLARAEGESTNYLSVGIEKAVRTLSFLAETLCRAIPDGTLPAGLCLGSSALDERIRDEHAEEFLAACRADPFLSKIPQIHLCSDALIALDSLAGDGRGALLISGTGVMGLARAEDGTLSTVAGWGEVLGDFGSGYDIALTAVQSAIRYAEETENGLSPAEPDAKALHDACLSFFSLSALAHLIPLVYRADFEKSHLAAFSAEVARLDRAGNAAAHRILEHAADRLFAYARLLCAPLGEKPFPFGIHGSVLVRDNTVRERFCALMRQSFPQAEIRTLSTPAEVAAAQIILRRTNS